MPAMSSTPKPSLEVNLSMARFRISTPKLRGPLRQTNRTGKGKAVEVSTAGPSRATRLQKQKRRQSQRAAIAALANKSADGPVVIDLCTPEPESPPNDNSTAPQSTSGSCGAPSSFDVSNLTSGEIAVHLKRLAGEYRRRLESEGLGRDLVAAFDEEGHVDVLEVAALAPENGRLGVSGQAEDVAPDARDVSMPTIERRAQIQGDLPPAPEREGEGSNAIRVPRVKVVRQKFRKHRPITQNGITYVAQIEEPRELMVNGQICERTSILSPSRVRCCQGRIFKDYRAYVPESVGSLREQYFRYHANGDLREYFHNGRRYVPRPPAPANGEAAQQP